MISEPRTSLHWHPLMAQDIKSVPEQSSAIFKGTEKQPRDLSAESYWQAGPERGLGRWRCLWPGLTVWVLVLELTVWREKNDRNDNLLDNDIEISTSNIFSKYNKVEEIRNTLKRGARGIKGKQLKQKDGKFRILKWKVLNKKLIKSNRKDKYSRWQ